MRLYAGKSAPVASLCNTCPYYLLPAREATMLRTVTCHTLKVAAFAVPLAIAATAILLVVSEPFRDAVLPALGGVMNVVALVVVGALILGVSALVLGVIGFKIWGAANKVRES